MDINRPKYSTNSNKSELLNNSHHYTQNSAHSSRLNQAYESSKHIPSQASTSPMVMKEGKIIYGEIIDIRYNEIKLRTEPDQQVITARLDNNIPLNIGQKACFQVLENQLNTFTLKYIPTDTKLTLDSTIEKALIASNLPRTDRNRALVLELLNNRLPIDKQTLHHLIKISVKHKEASPLTLALMYKHNIPMTKVNIEQYENYQKGTHTILDNLQTLQKELSNLGLKPDTEAFNMINLHKNLLMLLTSTNHTNSNQSHMDGYPLINNPSKEVPTKETLNNTSDLISTDKITTDKINEPLFFNSTQQTTEQNEHISSINGQISTILSAEESEDLLLLTKAIYINEDMNWEKHNSLENKDKINSFHVSKDNNNNDTITRPDLFKQIQEGTITVNDFLSIIHNKLGTQMDSSIATLINSREYRKILEFAFHSKWTIKPSFLNNSENISKWYVNLNDDMNKLQNMIKETKELLDKPVLLEQTNKIQNNLQFMSDLNKIFNYIQLPIQLRNQEAHADIYVLSKKKTQQIPEEGFRVLLHLDLPNLGMTDIYLHMKNKNIKANLYLERTETFHIINEHISQLAEALNNKGYHLQAVVKEAYEKFDFSRDFIDQGKINPEQDLQRFTFDIRT